MANPNYFLKADRIKLIDDIKSSENVERKKNCLKDYEIYNDSAYKYVYDELVKQLSTVTANQMPIISNLNIAKAIVTKEATIYQDPPQRSYENINDADQKVLQEIYSHGCFDSVLGKSNKYYKLRNQTFLQVVPKNQKLKLRVIHAHNIDVVPDYNDPEDAFAYVVSTFDKTAYIRSLSDGVNKTIADQSDYKATLEKYQVTTKEISFVMDGKGDLLGDGIIENPIGELPFIDAAKDKDFEFFVRIGQALTDFTVDFNVAWSDLMYISRMQGYSVGVLSGDANLKPDSMIVGPNRFVFLPSNPANPNSKLELDFKSPTPNLEASLKSIESLINIFLSTRGVDIKSISISNSGTSYSSALEKLLAMIDQFKATKDDFDLYKGVEHKLHSIVTKYLALLTGTNILDRRYNVTSSVVDSEINVSFKEPQMVETTSEKLDNAQKQLDLGIADRVSILANIKGISEEMAMQEIEELDKRKLEKINSLSEVGVNDGTNQDRNI